MVFMAPKVLTKIHPNVNEESTTPPQKCDTCHQSKVVLCENEVVYSIPHSCGSTYNGNIQRCVNNTLRENKSFLNGAPPGHLAARLRESGCSARLEKKQKYWGIMYTAKQKKKKFWKRERFQRKRRMYQRSVYFVQREVVGFSGKSRIIVYGVIYWSVRLIPIYALYMWRYKQSFFSVI